MRILKYVLMLLTVILLAGCSSTAERELSQEEIALVGTWTSYNYSDYYNTQFVFNDDGTGFRKKRDADDELTHFTWYYESREITISIGNETEHWDNLKFYYDFIGDRSDEISDFTFTMGRRQLRLWRDFD